ncbi:MAG: biopolymer transporter ExbD [Phycisphaeraceae bacterium]|nr:MAG: biopolymer transporter ExbD [Phycisphaeraceae bacterium]
MNVTPMIDVVMCLIVFYLIVGHLVMEREGLARLPESAQGEDQDDYTEPVIVSVVDDATVLVDGVETAVDRLESVLAGKLAQEPGTAVRLRAGRDMAYELVDPVIEACRSAGVANLELATERSP